MRVEYEVTRPVQTELTPGSGYLEAGTSAPTDSDRAEVGRVAATPPEGHGWGAELDDGRKFWWGDSTKTIGDAIAAVRFTGPCGGNGESNP